MSYDHHQHPSPHDDHGPPLQHLSSTPSGALDIHREQSQGDSVHAQVSSPAKEHDQRQSQELSTAGVQWYMPYPSGSASSEERSSLAHALQWPSTPARPAVPPTCSTPVIRTMEMQWDPNPGFEVEGTPSWTAGHDTSPTALPFPFTFVSNPASRREDWAEQRPAGMSPPHQPTKLGGQAVGFNAAQWSSTGNDYSQYPTWPAGARQMAGSDDMMRDHTSTDGLGPDLGNGLASSPDAATSRTRYDNSPNTSPLGSKPSSPSDMPPVRDAGSLPFDWPDASVRSAGSQHAHALYPALPGLTQGLQTLGMTLDQLTTLGTADDTHNDSQLSINTSGDSVLSSPDYDNSWESSMSAAQSSMESSFASSRTPPQMKGWSDPSVSLSVAPPREGHMLEDATPRTSPISSGYVSHTALPVNLGVSQHRATDNGLSLRSSSPHPFASASQAAPLDPMDERLPWGPPPSPSSSPGCDFADPQIPSSGRPEPSQLVDLLGHDAMLQIQAKLDAASTAPRARPTQNRSAAPSPVTFQADSSAEDQMRQSQSKVGTEEVLVALRNLRMFLQGNDDQQHLQSVIELESSITQSRDGQAVVSSEGLSLPVDAHTSNTAAEPCPPQV